MNGSKIYRNTLPNSCPSLGSERKFSYKTSISQLCSGDIITVLHNMGGGLDRGVSCGLGKSKDRKSVVEGKSVSGRVDIGGRRYLKKKKQQRPRQSETTVQTNTPTQIENRPYTQPPN